MVCASEWGRGPGFKLRVADLLEKWFVSKADLKETLEEIINSLWEQSVISPLLQLVEESALEAFLSLTRLSGLPVRRL
jgi:hypothetical protein